MMSTYYMLTTCTECIPQKLFPSHNKIAFLKSKFSTEIFLKSKFTKVAFNKSSLLMSLDFPHPNPLEGIYRGCVSEEIMNAPANVIVFCMALVPRKSHI